MGWDGSRRRRKRRRRLITMAVRGLMIATVACGMVFLGREIQSIFQPRQQPGELVLNHPYSFSVAAQDRLTKQTRQDMTKSLHVSVRTNNRIHESIPNSTMTGFPKNLHRLQRHTHRYRCQDQPVVIDTNKIYFLLVCVLMLE